MLFREEKNETQNDQRTQINIVHKESVVQGLNNLPLLPLRSSTPQAGNP
jgi:hypothetical protein